MIPCCFLGLSIASLLSSEWFWLLTGFHEPIVIGAVPNGRLPNRIVRQQHRCIYSAVVGLRYRRTTAVVAFTWQTVAHDDAYSSNGAVSLINGSVHTHATVCFRARQETLLENLVFQVCKRIDGTARFERGDVRGREYEKSNDMCSTTHALHVLRLQSRVGQVK